VAAGTNLKCICPSQFYLLALFLCTTPFKNKITIKSIDRLNVALDISVFNTKTITLFNKITAQIVNDKLARE